MQKVQDKPTNKDVRNTSRLVKEAKNTSDVVIKIKYINPANIGVANWNDSALYNATGELIEDEDELQKLLEEKHKVRSQAGTVCGCIDVTQIDSDGPDGEGVEDVKKVEVEISPKVSYAGEGLEKIVSGKMLSWPLYLSENKNYF